MRILVYRVGFFSEMQRLRGTMLHAPKHGRWRQLRRDARYNVHRFGRWFRERKWHEMKSFFNGYLAEPDPFPDGVTRCGSGWTQQRALRSLRRQVRRPGVLWEELDREIIKTMAGQL